MLLKAKRCFTLLAKLLSMYALSALGSAQWLTTHTHSHIPHTYPAADIDVWGKIAVRSLAADSADSPIRPLDLSFFSQCVPCQHPTLLLAARRGECPTWTSDLTLQLHSLRAGSRRTNGARPTGTPVATHIFYVLV